jgi:hypothetical protein
MMQHHTDYKLGVAMIDRFTYATLEYFEHNKVAEDSKNNLKELVQPHSAPPPPSRGDERADRCIGHSPQFADDNYRYLGAQSNYRTDLFSRPLDSVHHALLASLQITLQVLTRWWWCHRCC